MSKEKFYLENSSQWTWETNSSSKWARWRNTPYTNPPDRMIFDGFWWDLIEFQLPQTGWPRACNRFNLNPKPWKQTTPGDPSRIDEFWVITYILFSAWFQMSANGLNFWDLYIYIYMKMDCYLGANTRIPNHRALNHQFTIQTRHPNTILRFGHWSVVGFLGSFRHTKPKEVSVGCLGIDRWNHGNHRFPIPRPDLTHDGSMGRTVYLPTWPTCKNKNQPFM